ncbi:MAG: hypothetical protein PVG54_14195 [Anaerolineae bacterium]
MLSLRRLAAAGLYLIAAVLLVGCSTQWPTAIPGAPATDPLPTETVVPQSATPNAEVRPSPTGPPPTATLPPTEKVPKVEAPAEVEVTALPLSGALNDPDAEVSGLAWYGDSLIILPQYPNFATGSGDGNLYALPKAEIVTYLDGQAAGPLNPRAIPFVAPGLADTIRDFEGYEAIAFDGERAYLTIEASPGWEMQGYLVAGQIASDLSGLLVEPTTITPIEPQTELGNKSDEALLVAGEWVVTLYEINGARLNPAPVAHLFDQALTPSGTIPMPHIEYRITDATALDSANRFWAINYFFPLEFDQIPDTDPLVERYGAGATHLQYQTVERLVEFQYDTTGIRLVDRPPIQLVLSSETGRNWEGLVRLDDRGFLLMTDRFPGTILGFVAAPIEE